METVGTGSLQNEVEKVMIWSIFTELFDFWLKLEKPYVAQWIGWGPITSGYFLPQVSARANIVFFKLFLV